MKNPFTETISVGILGGGQLGRMLCEASSPMGIDLHILDPNPECSCYGMTKHLTTGSFTDEETVYTFGKDLDILTIEIEHVHVGALKRLQKEGVQVFPQPDVIELIQDKGKQKPFYDKHGIPTAPFILSDTPKNEDLSFPCIQKTRTGGYDGKGVQKVDNVDQLWDAPSVIEECIDIEKELSVIVARSASGEIAVYPTVEMTFDPRANLVDVLICPANVETQVEEKAQALAKKIVEKLEIVGLLAVELFLTKSGEILVNEVAPRPHNSGHQSIEGNITSQFEQHLRSILNLPLGSTSITQPSVMVNLVGEDGHTGPVQYEGMTDILKLSGVHPHLYGKTETKPFRKMGHITIVSNTIEEALKKAQEVKKVQVLSS